MLCEFSYTDAEMVRFLYCILYTGILSLNNYLVTEHSSYNSIDNVFKIVSSH